MDFLDSLDLDTIDKKSHRVRSWYLYEQYKSLERSQLDAAQKLKDRSYQERILRQELSERRARRKLYDQFGLCQSESRLKKDIKSESTKTSVSASNDDFFESFCVLNEDERVTQVTGTEFSDDTFSQDGITASKCCIDDFKSVDDQKDDNCSYAGSVDSVVNLKPCTDEILSAKETEFMPDSIAEDINMQLDSVKEDILSLEKFVKLEDDDNDDDVTEEDSLNTVDVCESKHVSVKEKKTDQEYSNNNNNVIAMWSRLVSFAYQVVQLNHGNCYCDYSSQFLTAVLACDILRRGVNRMCHILQPYVSPINYATDDSDVSNTNLNLNIKPKKSVQSIKCEKICGKKVLLSKKAKTRTKMRFSARKFSEPCWQPLCKKSLNNKIESASRFRHASEPWGGVATLYNSKDELSQISSSNSSIWPGLRDKPRVSRRRRCCYHNRALNPMLKIARYIDAILQDIDDSKHDM